MRYTFIFRISEITQRCWRLDWLWAHLQDRMTALRNSARASSRTLPAPEEENDTPQNKAVASVWSWLTFKGLVMLISMIILRLVQLVFSSGLYVIYIESWGLTTLHVAWRASVRAAWGSAFLWHRPGMCSQIPASIRLTSCSSHTNQYGEAFQAGGGARPGGTIWNYILPRGSQAEGWCSWSPELQQRASDLSFRALRLCHFPKMWVSLVNTLNPRPEEHIMASCSVGNRLRPRGLGLGEACQIVFRLRHGFVWDVWLHRQYAGRVYRPN